MADAESLRRIVHDICATLFDVGLARAVNYPQKSSSGDAHCISWPRHANASGTTFETSMLRRYSLLLRYSEYTALLQDGALLQLTYWLRGRDVVRHRLHYQAAPVLLDEGLSFDDFLELASTEELLKSLTAPASLRFDYDPAAAAPNHPSSHLTICGAHCRIPVSHPLSPAQFVKFVVQHYYPDRWAEHPRVGRMHENNFDPCISDDDMRRLHVRCKE